MLLDLEVFESDDWNMISTSGIKKVILKFDLEYIKEKAFEPK